MDINSKVELFVTNDQNILYNLNFGFIKKVTDIDIPDQFNTSYYYVIDFDVYVMYNNFDNGITITDNKFNYDFFEYCDLTTNIFMYRGARMYNMQRIKWIDSLNINFIDKTVLEVGCGGVGDFTRFLYSKNPKVLHSCDARQDVLDHLCGRLPFMSNNVYKINVEQQKDFNILPLEKYDIIICVGLLYHIANPLDFLKLMSKMTNTFVLETMLSKDCKRGYNVEYEDATNINQSYSGIGNRYNKDSLYKQLSKLFTNVNIDRQPESSEVVSGVRFTYFCTK